MKANNTRALVTTRNLMLMLSQILKWKRMTLTAMQVITKVEGLILAPNHTGTLSTLGDVNTFGALFSPQTLLLWVGGIWNVTNAFALCNLQSKTHLENLLLTMTLR